MIVNSVVIIMPSTNENIERPKSQKYVEQWSAGLVFKVLGPYAAYFWGPGVSSLQFSCKPKGDMGPV